jgi:hypothetical protein
MVIATDVSYSPSLKGAARLDDKGILRILFQSRDRGLGHELIGIDRAQPSFLWIPHGAVTAHGLYATAGWGGSV